MKQFLLLLLCFPLVVNGSENQARTIINEMEELYRGNSSELSMTMQVKTPQYSRSLEMFGQTTYLAGDRANFRKYIIPNWREGWADGHPPLSHQ